MPDTIQQQIEALRKAFQQEGSFASNLLHVEVEEKAYGDLAAQNSGFLIMRTCFLSLLHESLTRGQQQMPQGDKWQWYPPLLLFYSNVFSRARAADHLFSIGYPLDGLALLRDLKDRAIFMSAVLAGKSSTREILGFPEEVEGVNDNLWAMKKTMHKAREKVQRKVISEMTGQHSDLPENVQSDLKKWEILFNEEVHLSLHTFAIEGYRWFKGRSGLPIGPQQAPSSCSMYMNRAVEVYWCLLRTIPILQSSPQAFGAHWIERWKILDGCLSGAVQTLADSEKEIVPSLISWVGSKFSFDPSWCFAG